MKKTYEIYAQDMCLSMNGDRLEDAEVGNEYGVGGGYATFGEAEAAMLEFAKADELEIHSTRYGIGSISRSVYWIYGWREDEDCDPDVYDKTIWLDADGNDLDEYASCAYHDVLDDHPAMREKFNQCKQSYYDFLDYKEDWYDTITDEENEEDEE